MNKIRVLLAEDHPLFRDALQALLEIQPEIEIAGIATNGQEVLQYAREMQPDVVCMDICMPGLDGIEATRQLLATQPGIKIVGLSAHNDSDWIKSVIAAGALGYVDKFRATEELVLAIRAVQSNQRYLCSNLPATVLDATTRGRAATGCSPE